MDNISNDKIVQLEKLTQLILEVMGIYAAPEDRAQKILEILKGVYSMGEENGAYLTLKGVNRTSRNANDKG